MRPVQLGAISVRCWLFGRGCTVATSQQQHRSAAASQSDRLRAVAQMSVAVSSGDPHPWRPQQQQQQQQRAHPATSSVICHRRGVHGGGVARAFKSDVARPRVASLPTLVRPSQDRRKTVADCRSNASVSVMPRSFLVRKLGAVRHRSTDSSPAELCESSSQTASSTFHTLHAAVELSAAHASPQHSASTPLYDGKW